MLPVKTDVPQNLSRLCPGARRSFFCRMKCKTAQQAKEGADMVAGCRRKNKMNSDKKYSVIQCTGYLKSWAPAKIDLDQDQEMDGDGDSCNLSCLVAVGRILPNGVNRTVAQLINNYPNMRSIQFISRHAIDGKFLFVDQRYIRRGDFELEFHLVCLLFRLEPHWFWDFYHKNCSTPACMSIINTMTFPHWLNRMKLHCNPPIK